MTPQTLFKSISGYCKSLEKEFDLIPPERKEKLLTFAQYFFDKLAGHEIPKVIVICTHNSRRSHLGQIWLAVGADYYQLPEIQTYSGGTEGTAFNPRAVDALVRAGFEITSDDANHSNPVYNIRWQENRKPYLAFSKKYDDNPNPKEKFAAIMVCSEADEACPFVAGTDFRLSLPFEDPKAFDVTELESQKYDERCRQIGREMLFVLSQVKNHLPEKKVH